MILVDIKTVCSFLVLLMRFIPVDLCVWPCARVKVAHPWINQSDCGQIVGRSLPWQPMLT